MALPPSRASGPYRPTRLGQWEVVAKIAGGGMSAVYLGRSVDSPPDAPNVVALKIARHDAATDPRLVQMFLEEGKLIQRLVHPCIVRTLEVGADAEQDFIAMELMLGKTFAAIHDTIAARGVRLSPEIAAWTAARVADALHYAHELTDEHGRPLALVHRDVNPANVFATFAGEVKLFDFGLAKVTAGEQSSSQMLAGKLSYLSPEQIMAMPLDRRSDIFSLGTTLWELLTSQRLFRRDSDIETVRAVQLGPIPDPRAIAADIPEELARIVKIALERNREHRYPTAHYLARELDAWVYTRTSPSDVTARLAQLVDTVFPGEQKRQSGWLKPAITSSIARAATMLAPPVTSRPTPPEVRRDLRDTTAVMSGSPVAGPRPRPAREMAAVRPPDPNTPTEGVPAYEPGPLTPRAPRAAPAPPETTPDLESTIVASGAELDELVAQSGPEPELAPPSAAPPPPPTARPAPLAAHALPVAAPVPAPARAHPVTGPISVGPRPKRAPIPLPSRASVPPKPVTSPPKAMSIPPGGKADVPVIPPPPRKPR